MVDKYDHKEIEGKWGEKWEAEGVYEPDLEGAENPFYNLMMFPYPSAEGLHVGNMYAFTGSDIYGRFKRMRGFEVFEPIGLDGFGIHSENYALKVNRHPAEQAKISERNFYRQLRLIGNGFAWGSRLETYDPDYYRWTQWIFTKMYKRGLAYRDTAQVNWCPSCKTVLADEQVEGGVCERCKSEVERKELKQWFFRITDYADRLLDNLDRIDWTEKVKQMQRRWIGRSEGAQIRFKIQDSRFKIEAFTTRIDTLYGATALVVAPEKKVKIEGEDKQLALEIAKKRQYQKIKKYIKDSQKISQVERQAREKSGCFTGAFAVNPINGEKLPVWVADYVSADVGTGAIMLVPAHDERDFEFAQKFGLEIKQVIEAEDQSDNLPVTQDGLLLNSGQYSGLPSSRAREKMLEDGQEGGWAKAKTTYHLRDWLISRQRYWGPPIPIIYCRNCGEVEQDFLQNIEYMLANVTEENFEKINAVMAVGKLQERTRQLLGAQGELVYLNSYVLGKVRGWFDKFASHEEIPLQAYFLLPLALYAPDHVYKDRQNSSVNHFALKLPKHNLNVVIDIARVEGRNEITTLFVASDKYLERFEEIKELGGGTATSPSWLPDPKTWNGGSGEVSTLHRNSKEGFNKMGDKSQEILYKKKPAVVPVPEEELPVRLPEVEEWKPLGTGESPLAAVEDWVRTECPDCGGKARRETDVSDTFLDSAWYFLRYPSFDFDKGPWEKELTKKWLPVDMYIGGAEHSVLHLLYSRFVTMVFRDWGLIDFEEPFEKFRAHGLLIKEGAKMSKSRGNVVNPDEYIAEYGADTLRMYLMFIGPFEQGGDFQDKGIAGVTRFLQKLTRLVEASRGLKSSELGLERKLHRTIKKVGEDIEELKYNTAIAAMMELSNEWEEGELSQEDAAKVVKLLAPFAPFLAEELYQRFIINDSRLKDKRGFVSIHTQSWPEYDPELVREEEVEFVVQVDGKMRATMEVKSQRSKVKSEMEESARQEENVARHLGDRKVKKVIFVPGKLLNFVTE